MSQTISGTLYVGSGSPPNNTISDTSGLNTSFNDNKKDIDFSIKGTGNGLLYFDASAGRLGIGTGVPDAVLHVVAPCAKDGLIVESVTNCPTGVTLLLVHNPQTTPQSGSYPAIINLAGRDTNYNEIAYGQVLSKILDPVTGFTSGEIIFTVDDRSVNKPVFSANLRNIKLGANNSISGYSYNIVGSNNAITGSYNNIIGSDNRGVSSSSISVGTSNYLNGSRILSMMNESSINGNDNTILGNTISITGSQNILVGKSSTLSGSYNILLGNSNSLQNSSTVGLLQMSVGSGISGVVLGSYVYNTGNNNIYIGNLNTILGDDNSIVGSLVNLTGHHNLIYGSSEDVIGSRLICIGSNQSIDTVTSGIFVGNNISLSDSYKSMVIGLGNNTSTGLEESTLVGINNSLSDGTPTKLLLIGQNNITKDIRGSLIVGNANNLSGTVNNNLVVGATNAVAPTSNNNLVIGVLNNQTGVYIDSAGSITGVPKRISGTTNNSIVAGINNNIQNGNSNIIVGNKNSTSGSNSNTIGSYNNLKNSSNTYSLGNSNFLVGGSLGAIGSKISVVGSESLVFNTSDKKMDVFGSGNIVIGYNQMVSSGIAIGTSNKIDGINNIVYGRSNTLGSTRNSCTINSAGFTITIPTLGIQNIKYIQGDKVLICLQNPPSVNNIFLREISAISENTIDNTTTINISVPVSVDSSNGYYSINNAFDDNNTPLSTISGLIMPYQRMGGVGGPEVNPIYGSDNIIIGSNNKYTYSSGLIIGNSNNISGIGSVAIGYNMSGVGDNTLYLGTNNKNKIILDNNYIVFNSGNIQDNIIVKSSDDGSTVVNVNLNSNRMGINTDNPTSDLSVSGLLTTTDFKLGFSSEDAYVLTSDTQGVGTWRMPVRLTGPNSGLLYKVNDKLASGISSIIYSPESNQIGFNLGGNNGLYITSTGLLINDSASTYKMKIRGSGGADFARTLFETNLGVNRIDFYNTSGNSGIYSLLNVISGVKLPTNLTGTFMYVNNSGNLNSYITPANSILFANSSSLATGNISLRWFNSQQALALGATGVGVSDVLENGAGNTNYNIILSSTNTIDTMFNNRAGGEANFKVWNSGRTSSFNIGPTGLVTINSNADQMTAARNADGVALYVNGKTWVSSLKIGGSQTSGLYLRVDQNGNVTPGILDIKTQFSGLYPITVNSTPLGDGVSFRQDIGFSSVKSFDTAGNVASTLGSNDDGTFLVWRGEKWITSSGLKVYQNAPNGQPSGVKGIEFGYKALTTKATHNHVFAGGSFRTSDPRYDGSSQFAQYYLRTRTSDNGLVKPLITNWTKSSSIDSGEKANNCISLDVFSSDTSYDYDRVWGYNIDVSVLWQNGSLISPNTNSPKFGGAFFIQGAIIKTADGTRFEKLGSESIVYKGDNLLTNMGLSTQVIADNPPRLSIVASGAEGSTALWSATARINQINHLGSVALYIANA